jgi:hypothetical protein
MNETTTPVSLKDGASCKTFAAELTGQRGQPLKGVEVTFVLEGDGSLAADAQVKRLGCRTDGLGRAAISFNRLDVRGDMGAVLRAACECEATLHLRLLAMTR